MQVQIKVGFEGDKEELAWLETCDIPGCAETPQALIDSFNAQLKPGERRRQLFSYEVLEVVVREDVSLFLAGEDGCTMLDTHHIEILFRPSSKFFEFLNTAPIGKVIDISDECNGLYTHAVIIAPGQEIGISESVPTYDVEDCVCGEPASNMEWYDGGWVCPDCGEDQ